MSARRAVSLAIVLAVAAVPGLSASRPRETGPGARHGNRSGPVAGAAG